MKKFEAIIFITQNSIGIAAFLKLSRLPMEWGYVMDQGNILVIVDVGSGWTESFPAGNRTSKTVKVYLSQIFAMFGITKI